MTLARKHSLVCLVILWLYVVGCVQENETRRLWTAPGPDCFPADPAAPWAKCQSWPRPHISKALHQDRNWMWRGRDIWTSDKKKNKVEVCTGGVSVLESALLTTVTLPSLTASSRDKFKLQNCSEEATTLASWLLCSCFWSHKRISASNQCFSSTQNQVAIAICQTVQAEQQEEELANVHKQGDKRSPKAKAKSYVHHKIRNQLEHTVPRSTEPHAALGVSLRELWRLSHNVATLSSLTAWRTGIKQHDKKNVQE